MPIGRLAPDDYKTSLGPTVVGDWYINFGFGGIIFGMIFLGLVCRFVFGALLSNSKALPFSIVMYSIFWPQIIIGLENWIAPVWAGLVKITALLLLLYYFLTRGSDLTYKQ